MAADEVVEAEVVEAASTEVVLARDYVNGEELSVRDQPTDRLARFLDESEELIDRIKYAQGQVQRVLLERMDADLTWTHRVRDGDAEYELKSESPTAGTTAYDDKRLYRGLRPLVARGVITEDVLHDVVRRTVAIKAKGPKARTEALEAAAFDLGEYAEVSSNVAVHLPAVKKLHRLGNEQVDAAIAAAKSEATVTRSGRRVKVNVTRKQPRG